MSVALELPVHHLLRIEASKRGIKIYELANLLLMQALEKSAED